MLEERIDVADSPFDKGDKMLRTLNINSSPSYFFLVCRSSCSSIDVSYGFETTNSYIVGARANGPLHRGKGISNIAVLGVWDKAKWPYLIYFEHQDGLGNVVIRQTYEKETDLPINPGKCLVCPKCGKELFRVMKKN